MPSERSGKCWRGLLKPLRSVDLRAICTTAPRPAQGGSDLSALDRSESLHGPPSPAPIRLPLLRLPLQRGPGPATARGPALPAPHAQGRAIASPVPTMPADFPALARHTVPPHAAPAPGFRCGRPAARRRRLDGGHRALSGRGHEHGQPQEGSRFLPAGGHLTCPLTSVRIPDVGCLWMPRAGGCRTSVAPLREAGWSYRASTRRGRGPRNRRRKRVQNPMKRRARAPPARYLATFRRSDASHSHGEIYGNRNKRTETAAAAVDGF